MRMWSSPPKLHISLRCLPLLLLGRKEFLTYFSFLFSDCLFYPFQLGSLKVTLAAATFPGQKKWGELLFWWLRGEKAPAALMMSPFGCSKTELTLWELRGYHVTFPLPWGQAFSCPGRNCWLQRLKCFPNRKRSQEPWKQRPWRLLTPVHRRVALCVALLTWEGHFGWTNIKREASEWPNFNNFWHQNAFISYTFPFPLRGVHSLCHSSAAGTTSASLQEIPWNHSGENLQTLPHISLGAEAMPSWAEDR